MQTATAIARFVTGKTYSCRSLCDYNCVWSFVVVSRTEKTITIREAGEKDFRCGVKVIGDSEICFPLGRYSMAPVLTAARTA